MRDQGRINDETLRQLEYELDLREANHWHDQADTDGVLHDAVSIPGSFPIDNPAEAYDISGTGDAPCCGRLMRITFSSSSLSTGFWKNAAVPPSERAPRSLAGPEPSAQSPEFPTAYR